MIAMAMVALRVVRSVPGPRALYLDMARLTTRGLVRSRRLGTRLPRTRRPMSFVVGQSAICAACPHRQTAQGCCERDDDLVPVASS